MSKKWDNDFIAFSRNSRIGVIIILSVFLLVAITPRFLGYLNWEEPQLVEKEKQKKSDEKESKIVNFDDIPSFDPNKVDKEEWMNLGLSEKQAMSVINFRDKIGGFKDAQMLKKAYGISDDFFNRIESKLIFRKQKVDRGNVINNDQSSLPENDTVLVLSEENRDSLVDSVPIENKIEINSASYEELVTVKGIGNYFAERIIDLRIQRGGFTSIEQLLEINYFNEENLEKIEPYIFIDETKIVKINLNNVTLKQLSRHPEITWDMARSIIDLRKDIGKFTSLDQLLLSAHIDIRRYNKLKHYLTVEQ